MENGGDPLPMLTMAARESIEQENPSVPPSPREIPTSSSPPRRFTAPRRVNLTRENQSLINSFRSAALTPQETETCLQSLYNLMTRSEEEGEAQFREVISELDESDLRRMASLLTSNFDYYFLEIVSKKNGSIRMQTLFGKSDAADSFFLASILRHFLDVFTGRYANYVARQAIRSFSQVKQTIMRLHVISNVICLACNRHGCNALKEIIRLSHSLYREQLLFIVALNAHMLSYDAFGNFVVQYVLRLNDFRCTHNVAVILHGHCVELSFTKYGRFIVGKLLETAESRAMVVTELLRCDEDRLMWLAGNMHGNFVVEMALRHTQDEIMIRPDLFWGLVNKLMPLVPILRRSRGYSIAEFLESV